MVPRAISADTVRQVATFGVVGVTATAVHVTVALIAHDHFGLSPLWANCVAYLTAVSVSYLGNAILTFRKPVLRKAQFGRFATISLAAFALNQGTVHLCVDIIGWPFHWALGLAAVIVPIFTFVLSKIWAFVDPQEAAALADSE